ncbi:DUF3540 domain-containing protein [Marinibaculum pumilum]|uniref:DUF3540 domain-containing protein n=1 Tax=Marinibaculum pumilum TaxID=1766165 RepID=A0ABV7KWQ1_9PROT
MERKARTDLTLAGAVYILRVAEGADATGPVVLDTPDGPREADVAVSCLVRPEPGDEVSALVDGAGRPIVQAILRRPGGGPLTVTTAEGLTLTVGATSLHLDAEAGAVLASDRMIALAGESVDVRAARAFASLGTAVWRAQTAYALVGRLMTAADSLVTQAGQLLTRAKVSIRSAETLDKTDAPLVEIRGHKGVSIYGETSASLNAGEDVRVNAKRINIG